MLNLNEWFGLLVENSPNPNFDRVFITEKFHFVTDGISALFSRNDKRKSDIKLPVSTDETIKNRVVKALEKASPLGEMIINPERLRFALDGMDESDIVIGVYSLETKLAGDRINGNALVLSNGDTGAIIMGLYSATLDGEPIEGENWLPWEKLPWEKDND